MQLEMSASAILLGRELHKGSDSKSWPAEGEGEMGMCGVEEFLKGNGKARRGVWVCVSVPCLLLGHGRWPWENRVGTVGLGCASPYRGELVLGMHGAPAALSQGVLLEWGKGEVTA